ncbi:MAG: sulfite exporter TauE/SafE family protein [Candidatus Algichlamydia australiensis]|nr:sulfite exporter TauE/SafE family protein [Chlamydiales bacterium]
MELLPYILLLLTGVLAGTLAGLLGIGGGIVTTPCLVAVFSLLAVDHTELMHLAIGTSLACMVLTSASSTIAHHRKKGVVWSIYPRLGIGIIPGAILGAYVAKLLPSSTLRLIFGLFVILVGLHFLRKKQRGEEHPKSKSLWLYTLIGFGVSSVSALLGIGGGLIMVPLLHLMGLSIRSSVGTAASTGLLVAVVGTISFLLFGLNDPVDASGQLGFVYLPAFLIIGIVSPIFAPIGAHFAHKIPTNTLRKIFALALILAGIALFL